jgi:hypothetical protein
MAVFIRKGNQRPSGPENYAADFLCPASGALRPLPARLRKILKINALSFNSFLCFERFTGNMPLMRAQAEDG